MPKVIRCLIAAMSLIAVVSCGGKGGDDSTPPPPAATAPTITAQPASLSVTAGQSASFSVAATGTAPLTYQWRRDGANIAGATSAAYAIASTSMGDSGSSMSVVVTNAAGTATSSAAFLTVTEPAGAVVSITNEQTTALLTAVGQTAVLGARAVDAQGRLVGGSVTWISSNPADVTVDSTGRITAQAIGSAMLFAEYGGLRSQPIFVFVAEPKPGALVLSDEQVMSVGTPAGVAPGETPASGARYEVLVSGVAPAPAPGTVVISSGDAPVAGKVVSTRDEAGNLVLTLELAPLPQLLARYHIDWEIDLAQFPLEPIIGETTDSPQAMAVLKTAQTTSLNVVDCQSELKASLFSSKVSLTPHMDAKLIVQTSRNDPTLPPGFAKLALTGSQTVTGEVSVKLNAGFEGRVRCVASVPMRIPVTGALSVLVMPSLRVGAGFELEGSVIAVTGELTAKGTIGARETIGFQCGSQIAAGCEGIGTLEGISDFEFKKKMPSVNDMKVELSGQIFAYAGLNAAFGLGLLEAEILEARVGPKQSFELAFEDDQAHNPNVASNYKLEIAGSVEPGAAITTAIKKLIDDDNVSINLQVPFSTPLAESPKGSFDVSSDKVRYGTPVAFQVHLDAGSLRYPLLGPDGETVYNVDAVKIFRRREPDSEFTEFASIPASNGQSTFQYEWTPTSSDLGDYEFAAFVDTAMPVGYLEVATDTRKRLHVMGPGWYGNVTFAMRGSETQEDSGSYEDGSFTQTKTYGISASGTYRLEPLPDAPEAPVLKITASGTMTKTMAGQWDATYRSNGCDVTATQTEESIETATLAAVEGATGFLDIRDDGTVSVMIPNLFGRSHETYRVQASATRTGGPQCTPIAPTDRTTELDGSLSTDTIIAEGRLSEDQKSISANTRMTIEGMPDREYEVSVTLQR